MQARFFALLVTRTMSIGASGIFFLAVAWLLLGRGGGSAQIAGLAVCLTGPGVLVSLAGGVAIDRYDRRRIGQLIELGRAVVVGALYLLGVSGWLHSWQLYLGTALIGLGNAVAIPCYGAIMPQLVRKDRLVSANAVWQIATQVGAISASALGGVLVGMSGELVGFGAAGVCYLVGAVALLALPRSVADRDNDKHHSILLDLTVAAKMVAADRTRLYITVFSVLPPTVLWIANFLLPPFTKEQLGAGPVGFGLVEAVWGVGALVGGLMIPLATRLIRSEIIVLTATLYSCGLTIFIFSLAPGLGMGIALALLVGLSLSCAGIVFPAFVQANTPDAHLGRVLSGVQFVSSAVQLLVAAVVWAIGEQVSAAQTFLVMAICVVIAGGVFHVATRRRGEESINPIGETASIS